MIDAIIVSGGNIQKDFALDFLKKEISKQGREQILLIAADRGLDFLLEAEIYPDIAVGDFDSLSEHGKEYLDTTDTTEVIRLKPEKDDSDTQSAMMLAKDRGRKDIVVLGATGSRVDHLMANFGLLLLAEKHGIKISLIDRNNYISLLEKETVLEKELQFGKYVSFFPLGSDVEELTLEGFKYPLRDYTLTAADSGLTVSNEIVDAYAKILYKTGNLMMIMSRD